MDAPYYNGDDTRDFGPSEDEAPCVHCGARSDEECTDDCTCSVCEHRHVGAFRPEPDPPTFDDALAFRCAEQQRMDEARRVK